MSFFDTIAREIHQALVGDMRSATLHVVTDGAAGAVDEAPAEVETDHACLGFVETYEDREIDGTEILRSDRRVTLLSNSIANGTIVPGRRDYVTIEDNGTATKFRIVNVGSDPANATYWCQARR